jgi:hypothetical protein
VADLVHERPDEVALGGGGGRVLRAQETPGGGTMISATRASM